jgi:hypothetical protein
MMKLCGKITIFYSIDRWLIVDLQQLKTEKLFKCELHARKFKIEVSTRERKKFFICAFLSAFPADGNNNDVFLFLLDFFFSLTA